MKIFQTSSFPANRKSAINGSFVEIDLGNLSSEDKRKSREERSIPEDTVPPTEPGPSEVDVDFENEEEEEEDEYQVPNLWMHFVETINPLDVLVWKNMALFWKIFELIRCPSRFILTLIIPLVDSDHPTKGWCKLLSMLQCFLTPFFWAFATKSKLADV